MVNISFGSRSLETWGFAIFVLHPQIDILEEFKIMNPPCPSCEDILRQVDISFEAEMHVIQRHYSSERVQDRSMFTNNIPPRFFFEEVVDRLRSGVLEGAIHRHRLIYFCKFGFIVGNFPNRQGILCETCHVKVVCTITKCPNHRCRRLLPERVVTMYPANYPRYL